ncbi:transposase [Streptomyces sp. NPDC018610]|uniref:transposase n=1 Tax=Streptomyces sp. NPDC018610 TaxID=3365049 RepID=UPI0037BB3E51
MSTAARRRLAVHSGPAVLFRSRAGAGRRCLGRGPGPSPARTSGRRDRDHRSPAPRSGRTARRSGSTAGRGPGHRHRQRSGYDVTRLAWGLRDLPVELVGRIRSDPVLRPPKPPRMHGVDDRPLNHGRQLRFSKPETWPARDHHRHGHRRLRQGRDPGVGPGPPKAHPPLLLARGRGRVHGCRSALGVRADPLCPHPRASDGEATREKAQILSQALRKLGSPS